MTSPSVSQRFIVGPNSLWFNIVSCAVGVVFFFVCFPSYILNPEFVDWLFHKPSPTMGQMDLHPHYLGWYFLRYAPVSFPLGAIPNFGAPAEIYLAYTDSIPLLAFLFLPFSNILPAEFQYLGPFVFLSCVLQGYFAGRILSRWIKDPVCLFAAIFLVTFSPVLIWQWLHVALMAHWLLLWSLDLNISFYEARQNNPEAKMPLWRPMFIIGLAVIIQPYLAAMVAGICWALPLTKLVSIRLQKRNQNKLYQTYKWQDFGQIFGATLIWVLFMGVVLYVFGFFKGEARGEGFHWFGTDLLSLFNNHGTSNIIPAFRKKAGLGEGYAWPGLGGWLLFLLVMRKKVRNQFRELWMNPHVLAVAGVCAFMWFFALSERTYIGTFWIIDMKWFWDPFKSITSALRTCGRFVWPGYYFMMMGSAVLVTRYYGERHSIKFSRLIFLAAIVLQLVDLGPWFFARNLRYGIHGRQELKHGFWTEEALRYKHFKLIPPSLENGPCFTQKSDYWYEWPEFARYAAPRNMTVNSGFFARYDYARSTIACGAEWYEFITGPLKPDSIYVLRRGYDDHVITQKPDRNCREIDGYMICTAVDMRR